jgi:hypothetical protein
VPNLYRFSGQHTHLQPRCPVLATILDSRPHLREGRHCAGMTEELNGHLTGVSHAREERREIEARFFSR